jgi:hypothetical protein
MLRIMTFILLSVKSFAYSPAPGNGYISVGPLLSKTNFSNTNSGAQSPFQPGFGVVGLGDISSYSSIEVMMFYTNKFFFREHDSQILSEKTELLQISMGYRRYFSEFVSTAIDFYSSYSIGDPQIIHSDFLSGTDMNTSARDFTEYGFDFSLQFELWREKKSAFILDNRYSLSVTNKNQEYGNSYLFFLAYQQQIK